MGNPEGIFAILVEQLRKYYNTSITARGDVC